MNYQIGDCTLDTERYELRRAGMPEAIQPQVLDLLILLVENRKRIVTKDEIFATIWPGRVVSDATLSSRISAARSVLGDDGTSQRVIKTVPRRGFRFVAEVTESQPRSESEDAARPSGLDSTRAQTPSTPAPLPPQEIRFHTTSDGASIAYSIMGDGRPLVKAANWMNHLEYEVSHPPMQAWWAELSANYRLIRYDQRGNGLSDAEIGAADFEMLVDDLSSLIDDLGLERFALLGISQSCAVSVAYAVRHPERVACMILYGGYVRGWRKRGVEEHERGLAFNTLIKQGWGQDNPAYRQLFASMFMPDASADVMAAFNEQQRIAVTADNAVRLHDLFGLVDVSALLPRVATPTLVAHCRDDARAPFAQGRAFAAGIPGSRFVPLPGRNHLLQPGEPAWRRLFDEMFAFVDQNP
ncbi:MAG: alpha/beta fold hydrolase [Gammaproteobacteria bacterium]|nr:alpha/beta fold hydrolase [Gammaproteobacteria bacterium]